jgi:hypothetical protein
MILPRAQLQVAAAEDEALRSDRTEHELAARVVDEKG